jgi:hypothetical protein
VFVHKYASLMYTTQIDSFSGLIVDFVNHHSGSRAVVCGLCILMRVDL